jgi:hypothetical protein
MIPGLVLVVWGWWCGAGAFYNNTAPTEVVLNRFGLLVGLWQYFSISVSTFLIYKHMLFNPRNMGVNSSG